MGTMVLVRHGQASFFSEDYDRLSPLGEEQARRLGAYWAARGVAFDEAYAGPRVRQRRTAEIVGEEFARAGRPFPAVEVLEGFDEYDGDAVVRELGPLLSARDERARLLAEAFAEAKGDPERRRHFQRMFEAVTGEWRRGSLAAPGVESWRSFHDRVREALGRVRQGGGGGGGRRVAVFTSGGPVAIAAQIATRAPEDVALELSFRVRNGSVTEIVFSPGRVTLDAFNATPHLDEALVTFR
ncbi:MAG TPA: histidine phosphatase family protein [Polyangiaceae bacterium]|nr:histidine phosphatase family protein [Polyangiaceae bacterium]